MKKISFLLLSFILLISCNSPRPKKNCSTYDELPDPSAQTAGWSEVKPGLNASFGSIDMRYSKSSIPVKNKINKWEGSGWKGERLSAQVVLWTNQPIEQVECEFSDFTSDKKEVLSSNIANARFVRYVMTDVFGAGCGHRKPEDFPSSLSADALDNVECMNLDSNTVRPVWITFDIPRDAQAGTYKGNLNLFAQGQEKQTFEIQLEVINKTLPPAREWQYHLDLWQHPSAVARWHKVPVWSDQHFELMRPLMEMLANAGQKVITATLNKDPWNGQCFDRYEDMISWTKKADGTWEYDYTHFDRWVNFMMDLGITKMINCYSMVPWNDELHYKDEAKGEMVTIQAIPGKPIFNEIWTPFLLDFTKHLKAKNWLEITNIAMDERAPEVMKATIGLIHKVTPELGIALADNHKSYKEYPFIKDMCVAREAKVDSADLAYRKANHLNTTYYVCCADKFPNVFTFSPPAEAVYSAWYSVAAGFDGYLRWAYNSWVENPLTDSRFRTWPAGDTYIVYPENRSSIRFERLIEGVQDAEKIRILRDDLAKAGTQEATDKLKKLNDELAKFNTTEITETSCQDVLNPAKQLLNELSK